MVQIEVDGEWMEQCDDCGNIWDGNAQCNCWQWWAPPAVIPINYDSSTDESGYESE